MQIFYNGLPRFWVDYSILHLYPPSGADEGGGLVTAACHCQFVMKKVMMVLHFVSNSHKVIETKKLMLLYDVLFSFL
jgi:cephalosporin-C deacetylase-like acetyl esterase